MSRSNSPPEYLMSCLFSIEQTVVVTYKAYPQLHDKEVEEIYKLFKDFFQKLSKGKELYDPSSSRTVKQALIEALLQALDAREEFGIDDEYILNEEIQPGGAPIPNLEAFYALFFKRLEESTRFWRKEGGRPGYLSGYLPG